MSSSTRPEVPDGGSRNTSPQSAPEPTFVTVRKGAGRVPSPEAVDKVIGVKPASPCTRPPASSATSEGKKQHHG